MKKSILSIIAVFVCFMATAQRRGSVEASLSGGYNWSTIYSDTQGTFDNHGAYNLSAGLDFYLSRDWSIRIRAINDRKGFNNVVFTDNNGFDFKSDVALNYVTVPVQASWHFGRTKNWYFNFGGYAGFLNSAKETRFNTNLKPDFNDTDAGLALGLGVKIPVGDKLRLFFEYDYQYGLTELYKVRYDNEHTNVSRSALNVGLNFLLQ